jgi:phosphatidylserine/phosphatidylglycerophosphate/cardiolipin synthase-like enzyme
VLAEIRALQFRKFLDEVERNVPDGLDVHVVMDHAVIPNSSATGSLDGRTGLSISHRLSSSWIDKVERFFRRSRHRTPPAAPKALEESASRCILLRGNKPDA